MDKDNGIWNLLLAGMLIITSLILLSIHKDVQLIKNTMVAKKLVEVYKNDLNVQRIE